MAAIAEKIILPIESAFDSLGALNGTSAPVKRAGIVATLTALALYVAKPTMFFNAAGDPRPLFSDDPNNPPASVHVSVPILASAALAGTII